MNELMPRIPFDCARMDLNSLCLAGLWWGFDDAIGLSILRSAKPQLRYVALNIAMLAAVFWPLLTFVQHWQANPVAIGTQSAFSSGDCRDCPTAKP